MKASREVRTMLQVAGPKRGPTKFLPHSRYSMKYLLDGWMDGWINRWRNIGMKGKNTVFLIQVTLKNDTREAP